MGKAKRFFRSYTEGVRREDIRRLFQRDAARAYAVLARDHADIPEPRGRVKRWWHRLKISFLGLSAKLTPARRLLFGVSLLCVIVGMLQVRSGGDVGFTIGFSPGLTGIGVIGLVYLIALELADRVTTRDELEVARQLQRDLLPRVPPDVPGWRFASSYRTANEVGGDYYDFVRLEDGRLAILAGDASGHGMAAGLVMAIANATLKLALDLDPAPERVARLLNRTLWRTGTRRNFMSFFYALLDPTSGRCEWVCAGHPFPILRRADGSSEELGVGGFPLGVRETVELETRSTTIGPGDLVAIYSDGLPETRSAGDEAFGFERVGREVRAGGTPAEIHDRLLAAMDRFRGEEPLIDDVSLVIVERRI